MHFKRIVMTGYVMLLLVATVLCVLLSYRSLMTKMLVIANLDKTNETKNASVNDSMGSGLSLLKHNVKLEQPPPTKSTTTKPATIKETTAKAVIQKTSPTPKPDKLVLFYTPMWGHVPWQHLKNTRDTHAFTHVDGNKPCSITNCRISYDKNDLAKSHAVLFHARDMPSLSTLKEMSKNRNKDQRWVFWTYENPYYVWLEMGRYNNLFNWTMTYRRDSDIFRPYGNYRLLDSNEKPKDLKNHAKGKDKLVGWMVSNCRSHRKTITAKLMKYGIDVTVLGKCGLQFGQRQPCDLGPTGCESFLKRFKFYLSFENLNCIDYVTEKYWHTPFHYGMVPLVFGPRNYDSNIAVPGSYINVRNYSSMKDLADYLRYLDKNDTAFNEYFQWKLKYKLEDTNPWNCQMCEMLNNPNLPVKVYNNLSTYWGEKSSCEDTEEIVNNFL